jgi:hypothetical protein
MLLLVLYLFGFFALGFLWKMFFAFAIVFLKDENWLLLTLYIFGFIVSGASFICFILSVAKLCELLGVK